MFYISIINIILGLIGAYIAYYVFRHKTSSDPMTCSMEHDCDAVVSSPFGTTFGIENALIGLVYFLGIIISYALIIWDNFSIFGYDLSFWVMLASIPAVFFSGYLLFVMRYKLNEWCDWCIASSAVSFSIALLAIIGYLYF